MKLILFLFILLPFISTAQPGTKNAFLYKNREVLEKTLNEKVINAKLGKPLSDSTEGDWEDAFFAIQYLNRNDAWIKSKIVKGVTEMPKRSPEFQRAIIELIYNFYPGEFNREVLQLYNLTNNSKVFAMSGEYLNLTFTKSDLELLVKKAKQKLHTNPDDIFILELLNSFRPNKSVPSPAEFLKPSYLPRNVLMISFQRKNRNYPGLVIIRDTTGFIAHDSAGNIIAIPQLARSLSGLPGYLTNGNSPEGILRMDGYGISLAGAIGPTSNVQLTLPAEYNSRHFFKDSTLTDTIASIEQYKNILPNNFKNYYPIYEAFYAGKVGRTEIIAHGTTVKPEYYSGKPYFPFTPTMGCLCTFESWNNETGERIESDQQKLIDTIEKSGGPDGYAIIINIDNKNAPVNLEDILPFIKEAGQN